jgi:acyl-CoA synthetase (AMP-forming)/AMP-acid ligase II
MVVPLFEILRAAGSNGHPSARIHFVRRAANASYTAKELFGCATTIAAESGFSELPAGTSVGILCRSQQQQVLLYLACLSAGLSPAILTPFHARLSRGVYDESLSAVLRGSVLSVLVSLDVIPGLDMEYCSATQLGPLSVYRLGHPGHRSEGSILQFSSGTTGLKKAVRISNSALVAQLKVYGKSIGLSRADHIVSWLPLYHDMGFIACLNLPLLHGISVTMIDTFDWLAAPELFLLEAAERRATLSWNPNFFYSFMAERVAEERIAGIDLTSLRGLANCSEPATAESQNRFRARFGKHGLRPAVFWGCYAMAESTFALTHIAEDEPGYLDRTTPLAAHPPQIPSVGRALPGVHIDIVDEQGRELGDRTIGELIVSSPFNFSGYVEGEGQTITMPDQAYATGDLGYRIEDRYFVIGRKKDVVIVNGENIFPQQVEDVVGLLPEIASGRVAAFGLFDERLQSERLVVLAEAVSGQAGTRELVTAIRSVIAKTFFFTTVDVHLVESGALLKSSSGKMSRTRCRDWWIAQTGFLPPNHRNC